MTIKDCIVLPVLLGVMILCVGGCWKSSKMSPDTKEASTSSSLNEAESSPPVDQAPTKTKGSWDSWVLFWSLAIVVAIAAVFALGTGAVVLEEGDIYAKHGCFWAILIVLVFGLFDYYIVYNWAYPPGVTTSTGNGVSVPPTKPKPLTESELLLVQLKQKQAELAEKMNKAEEQIDDFTKDMDKFKEEFDSEIKKTGKEQAEIEKIFGSLGDERDSKLIAEKLADAWGAYNDFRRAATSVRQLEKWYSEYGLLKVIYRNSIYERESKLKMNVFELTPEQEKKDRELGGKVFSDPSSVVANPTELFTSEEVNKMIFGEQKSSN